MSEDNKAFTVKDRRQFTAEGERRDGPAKEEAPAETAPPAADHAAPTSPAGASSRAVAPSSEEPENSPHYPSDFPSLLLSLGSQASLLLLGDPETGGVDLAGARALITLLEVLKDKTEGRRTKQEDALLGGLLYELRMAYVARSRAAGP